MTLTRYHLVFLILVAVVAVAVAVAVYYVEHVYNERQDKIDKIKRGDVEDLNPKAPPKPPAQPPLERSTSRHQVVLAVASRPIAASRPTDPEPELEYRQVLQVRGNGEFMRLPSLPDEKGPVVTGLLDRAQVDDLIRMVTDDRSPESLEAPYLVFAVSTRSETRRQRQGLTEAAARPFLQVAGKEMNRSAVPEKARLQLAAADPGPAIPWPFKRATPDAFAGGALLLPESDRTAFRDGILRLLEPNARFSHKDRLWRVVAVDLLPR